MFTKTSLNINKTNKEILNKTRTKKNVKLPKMNTS